MQIGWEKDQSKTSSQTGAGEEPEAPQKVGIVHIQAHSLSPQVLFLLKCFCQFCGPWHFLTLSAGGLGSFAVADIC